MTNLLARLQAATQGNEKLDAAVLRAAGWRLEPIVVRSDNPLIGERLSGQWFSCDGFQGWDFVNPPSGMLAPVVGCPTRSLDAITGLIEARGWDWFRGPRMSNGVPMGVDAKNDVAEWFVHPSTPIALCIAFCRALEAQEGGA